MAKVTTAAVDPVSATKIAGSNAGEVKDHLMPNVYEGVPGVDGFTLRTSAAIAAAEALVWLLESRKKRTGPPRHGVKKDVNGSYRVAIKPKSDCGGLKVVVKYQPDDAIVKDLKIDYAKEVSAAILEFESAASTSFGGITDGADPCMEWITLSDGTRCSVRCTHMYAPKFELPPGVKPKPLPSLTAVM